MILKSEDKIVFAGDSTTDADKLTAEGGFGAGYVKLVHDELIAFHPQDTYYVFNEGISGNTSRDLLARWERDVASHEPDVLFCMIGINDVWRQFDNYEGKAGWISLEEYAKNMQTICEKGKKARHFCLLPPYFMEKSREDEMRKMTDLYAGEAKRIAKKNGVPVLDVQADFDEFMKHRSGISICWDRVHPNAIGSQILARAILKYCFSE